MTEYSSFISCTTVIKVGKGLRIQNTGRTMEQRMEQIMEMEISLTDDEEQIIQKVEIEQKSTTHKFQDNFLRKRSINMESSPL